MKSQEINAAQNNFSCYWVMLSALVYWKGSGSRNKK